MFQDVGYFALYREEFDRDNLGSVEIVRGRDEGLLEIDRTWIQMTSNSYSSAKFPSFRIEDLRKDLVSGFSRSRYRPKSPKIILSVSNSRNRIIQVEMRDPFIKIGVLLKF